MSETIEGSVDRLVFHNEDNGWTVLRISTDAGVVTAVGHLPPLNPGERLRLTGPWLEDPRFGRQLRVEKLVLVPPTTRAGIEKYLGSGLVAGIGRELARRMVDRFGEETLEIIEKRPYRLREVGGIGKKRAEQITEAWAEQRDVREVMLFLTAHDVSPSHAAKIRKTYGNEAIQVVQHEPYRLAAEISGIGFRSADRIAMRIGLPKDAPARAQAGLLFVVGEFADHGHVFVPAEVLLARAEQVLEVERLVLDTALSALLTAGTLRREPFEGDPIYLDSLYEAEVEAGDQLSALLAAPSPPVPPEATLSVIRDAARALGLTLAEQQEAAVRAALEAKVLVVTGGPGTGKTTIIRVVLAALTRAGQSFALAAPTGRAARRLAEASHEEATTLHRLLEYSPRARGFERNADRPLEVDVLIVDEASMIDLSLFRHVLVALPARARLILVGDVDQLPSVGPGAVLAELIASGTLHVTRLAQVFRQAEASAIVTNAHRIRRGEMPEKTSDPESDFFFIEKNEPDEILTTLEHLITERIPRRFGYDPIRDIQVLTPMHKGTLGAEALNQRLAARLNPTGASLSRGQRQFRVGDKVMQTRNDYERNLSNGDIGFVSFVDPEAPALKVRFDELREVSFEPEHLDALVLAYACSIHKSQGSEFPVVLLPLHTQHYVLLRRNLLYTAVTRGRELVVLLGPRRAIELALAQENADRRNTHLGRRVATALGRGPP